MKRFIHWCTILAALVTAPVLAQAQGTYPDRPIKFVISFPPGGATDTFFRQLTGELSAALGQPVVIENRGGAGGYIAWHGGRQRRTGRLHAAGRGKRARHQPGAVQESSDRLRSADAVRRDRSDQQRAAGAARSPTTCLPRTSPNWSPGRKTVPGSMNYAHAGIGSVSHLVFEVIRDGDRHEDRRRALQGRRAGDGRRGCRARFRNRVRHVGRQAPGRRRQGQGHAGHQPRAFAGAAGRAVAEGRRGEAANRRPGILVGHLRPEGHAGAGQGQARRAHSRPS